MVRTYHCFAFAILFSVIATQSNRTVAAPSHDQLLPKSTIAYLHASDTDELVRHWHQTQYARLYRDESMKRFRDEWRRFLDDWMRDISDATGLSLNDLAEMAHSEATAALVRNEENAAAVVFLVDVSDREAETESVLSSASSRLTSLGADQQTHQLHSTSVTVHRSVINGKPLQSASFIRDDTLCVATDVSVVEDVLRRWSENGGGGLDRLTAYREITRQCNGEPTGEQADLVWYIDPLEFLRITNPSDPRDIDQRDIIEQITKHGADAVKAVGGAVSASTGEADLLLRVMVYAPGPYRGAMAMFQLPSGTDFDPPEWIPNDVNLLMSINWDLVQVLDNVGALFDDIAGDGIEGTFNDILTDLRADDGPNVDLREDLFERIGPRVLLVNDTVRDGKQRRDRSVIAIETGDQRHVALALKRLLRDDPGVRRLRVPGFDYDLWQIGEDSGLFADRDSKLQLRSFGAMVARGHLLLATDVSALRKSLQSPAQGSSRLAEAVDLAIVKQQLDRLILGPNVGRIFSRTELDFQVAYEQLRSGTLGRSWSPYGLVLSQLLASVTDKETGKSKIDFAKLPPFDRVRQYFGLVGLGGKNTNDGWYIVGVSIPKQGPLNVDRTTSFAGD